MIATLSKEFEMSQSFHTAPAQNADALRESQAEDRIAARLLVGVVLFLAIVAVSVVIWGLPALTIVGLGATALVLLLLVAYAAGL